LFLYNHKDRFNFHDLLNSYRLLGEIAFPVSESDPSQHSIDDRCLDGLEIEDWPNWTLEFEREFEKPRLDLEAKYEKPTKLKRQPIDEHGAIFRTINDCWDLTVQVYLDQNYPGKYYLTLKQQNCGSSDHPDASLIDLSDITSHILTIEIKQTDTENASNTIESNCAKKVRLFCFYNFFIYSIYRNECFYT
jgi:hypothetical protein